MDSLNTAIKTIQVFDSKKVWDTFQLPVLENQQSKLYKLKLEITRYNKIIWTDFKQLD
jgi:hypothetical protein